ncbi:hypothetical protein [Spirosoma aerolatum]|uniref:hypothetical protein n=1 Tax=Spirosoma aerolatum TaxID=1211326 RepID=UPI0009AE4547|nr:hypothetical protein [Spirosoma aerolatum]
MKDFLIKLTGLDGLTLDHVMVTFFSLIGALLSTKNDVGMPFLVRALNTLAGFVLASLIGYILLERAVLPFLSSGISYLVGSFGYHIMNVFLTALKMAEIDPFSTAGKVINLIWSWKLPSFKKSSNDQS